ncbi:MAG: DUF308 domain-containing protein [Planctomycetota bacterium]
MREAVADRMARIWWTILLRGLLALALAACALIWPNRTIDLLVMLLGAYFVFDGVTGAIGVYRSEANGVHFLPAVMSLALGLVLLLWSDVSAKVFLILIGVWLVIQGIGLFFSGRRIKSETGEGSIAMAVAVLMVVVGCVFVFWTNTGITAVSWLLGLGALAIGAGMIYLALRLRKLQQRIAA